MLDPKPQPENSPPFVLPPWSRPTQEPRLSIPQVQAHLIDAGNSGSGGGGKKDKPEHLELGKIDYLEVERSHKLLFPQLFVTGEVHTIRRNIFCRIRLVTNGTQNPPEIFGRIVSCYPNPTDIKRAQLIEIHFPREHESPAFVRINGTDLDPRNHPLLETSLMKVPIWGDAEDSSLFEGYEGQFREKGFEPLSRKDPDDLMKAARNEKDKKFWLYVIGSGWLSSLAARDVSVYNGVIPSLATLVKNINCIIINMHEPGQSIILNEILNLVPQWEPASFYDASSFTRVLEIVEKGFDKLFSRPLKETSQ